MLSDSRVAVSGWLLHKVMLAIRYLGEFAEALCQMDGVSNKELL